VDNASCIGVLLYITASCSPSAQPAIVHHPSLTKVFNVAGRIEGYAIVSEDGMLATAARIMPDSLKFEADEHFFRHGLDGVDVVVHGRHSQEQQPGSRLRRRLVLTRRIPAIAAHPSNDRALLWNPAGASLEEALTTLGIPNAIIGVIGGTDVFALFLDSFDVFHLSRAPGVYLPGGRPVFPEVPTRTPEEVLAAHGLEPSPRQTLDAAQGLTMVSWQRRSKPSIAQA
jgi:dihydrofolate reductase